MLKVTCEYSNEEIRCGFRKLGEHLRFLLFRSTCHQLRGPNHFVPRRERVTTITACCVLTLSGARGTEKPPDIELVVLPIVNPVEAPANVAKSLGSKARQLFLECGAIQNFWIHYILWQGAIRSAKNSSRHCFAHKPHDSVGCGKPMGRKHHVVKAS